MFFRVLLLLLLSYGSFGQSSSDTITIQDTVRLSEIVVLSSYRATPEIPVSYTNLTKAFLEERNFGQEPSFIFAQTPSVTAYSDAGNYAGYAYFRLRGMDQTRVNMTLNGVPLNEPEDQGAYFSNYPDFLNSVQSVQIQRGVGMSANGVAGYAGSIQFESPSLHAERQGEVYAGFGSYNTYRLYAEYNSGVRNQTGVYARASHQHSDGYKNHSGNTSSSFFLSNGWFGKKHVWKLTGLAGNQRNELAWIGVLRDTLRDNPRYNANVTAEKDEFTQTLWLLQHSVALGNQSTLTSSVYYNYLQGNYAFDLNNFLRLPRTDELYNYAFRSHFVGAFTTYATEINEIKLYAGLHANTYNRRHTGSEQTAGQLYRNTGYKNELSAFAKAVYPLHKFTFFGDMQYRYTDFDYWGDVSLGKRQWNFFNPRAGVSYQVRPTITGYYSIGSTSREPTRNDLFGGEDNLLADSTGRALIFVTQPERVLDQELGIRLNNRNWQLAVNGYYMRFSDEIVLNGAYGPNGLPLRSDVASSFRSGVEIDAAYTFSNGIRLVIPMAFSYNRIQDGEITIEPVLMPRVIINPEITYRYKNLRVGLNGRYQGESYVDFANSATLPDFFVLDASAAYRYQQITFSLRVNNLTNRKYYTNGQIDLDGVTPLYFRQASANYFLAAQWNF